MSVEIPLRAKYRVHSVKKQTSRHEGNPNKKRVKAKGAMLEEAQRQTEAHRKVKVLDGVKIRWMSAEEWEVTNK